jgi:hypothetical protein
MPELTISQLLQFQPRFLRSVHLERDFDDPDSLSGYVVTPQLQNCFDRIANGLRPTSAQRAWRVTGDYGTGKSSFALALAHLVTQKRSVLPVSLQRTLPIADRSKNSLLPILVTGSREPIALAILRALHKSVSETCTRGRVPRIVEEIAGFVNNIDGNRRPGHAIETSLISLITESARYIKSAGKASGLLIILDELGKFLEYSALHPEEQDVYLMQQLAESASRSGSTPVLLVGLLHQGFNAYADQLSPSAQREWEKVAGRFDELIFEQPLEQTATLVAEALRIRLNKVSPEVSAVALRDMQKAMQLRCYGANSSSANLVQLANRLYPLHPTVIPALVRLFSKFGQNERSLFSFLLSNEAHGLRSFSSRPANEANFYRLHNLYDYARASFGHRLSIQTYRSHWNYIDSVISSYPMNREFDINVLKTIGILNLIDSPNLMATEDFLRVAMGITTRQVSSTRLSRSLDELQRRARVIYKRTESGAYCLWSHTSLDLDRRYQEARRALSSSLKVSAAVGQYLETRPLVARRHYIQTGNLRHFQVRYLTISDLRTSLDQSSSQTASGGLSAPSPDGQILIPLCETENERKEALAWARSEPLRQQPALLVAVTRPLNNLIGLVREAWCWQWINGNTPELTVDPLASEEVSRMMTASQQVLQKRIQAFVGLQRYQGRSELDWFHMGECVRVNSGKGMMSLLSDICDSVYPDAPRFRNELVNRHQLSSSASAARMRVIERLFSSSRESWLGMDPKKKPPEMSIYLSLLLNAGLHQLRNDEWRITPPKRTEDVCNVLPALRAIDSLLRSKADARFKVSVVFERLRQSPLGVRDGITPLLLAIYAVINEQHVAFYDNGIFMREMTGLDYMRLTKWPGNFEIQLCRNVGVRAELFDKLRSALQLSSSNDKTSDKAALLDIVRPLCTFIAQLPSYTQSTHRLGQEALSARAALLAAREPGPLLFSELPSACGFTPFRAGQRKNPQEIRKFVRVLKEALDDLRGAYPQLQERLKGGLLRTFQLSTEFPIARKVLSQRAEAIITSVTEVRLKAFCSRLLDNNLGDNDWIIALASFVTEMPPSKWKDEHEDRFSQELDGLIGHFERVERLTFDRRGRSTGGFAMRVAVTNLNGTERGKVIFAQKSEEKTIKAVEKKIEALLTKRDRIELAALATVFWKALDKK